MAAAQDLQSVPGVATPPDPATKDFIFQQARVIHAQCSAYRDTVTASSMR